MPAAEREVTRFTNRLRAAAEAMMIASGWAPTRENVLTARERVLDIAEEAPEMLYRALDAFPPAEFPMSALPPPTSEAS
jgi:hypothetical protein